MPSTTDNQRLSSSGYDFIDEPHLHSLMHEPGENKPVAGQLDDVIAKSMAKEALSLEETAVLLAADDAESCQRIFDAARQLKREVYGNRIVLFAPLYVGNSCTNDCVYCAFRRSNRDVVRRTLSESELRSQVEAIEKRGHKRTILVFGEHPQYSAEYMAECVRTVYSVRVGHGEIRRVNVNAAPLDHAGYALIKAAGIGTYQIFQETYHHETYARVHPAGTRKGDYLWRLDALARAMESGCDDVGIGALVGLYDWRFEVLSLVAHALHLQKHYGVGPHTISFPRLRPASGIHLDEPYVTDDQQFKRLVAVLRLAVPYTGMILTAREPAELRREVIAMGISQIDAGSRIELGGYTELGDAQVPEREQFQLGDLRPLDTVIGELIVDGYVPSFCTACYRLGRTGQHFMEFAIPGFIQDFCTPNALSTLMEYLVDYGSEEIYRVGLLRIQAELDKLPEGVKKQDLIERLRKIRESDARDLYY